MSSSTAIPLVDLKAQYETIKDEIGAAITGVLDHGMYVLGPDVKAFESDFAAFCDTKYAYGVSNGLDALRIALAALDVKAGDEVILPANTFIATALAVSAVGAKPVLVDCDPHTYEIDVAATEAAITPRTKVIIPVHLTGLMADMDPINALAERHGISVVEDAAQSQGATYKGRKSGSLGKIGCTSFFPGKNLGAYGDGGGITTNDDALAKKIDMLRNYGQEVKYHHLVQGLNCRLDSMQAAILRVKLRHLPAWNEARRAHAAKYLELLKGVGDLAFQHIPSEYVPVYHLFIIETARRDALKDYLTERGIGCGIHYPIPVHLQPAYAELGYREGAFPHAERLAKTMLTLPLYAEITDEQIQHVTRSIKEFFAAS